MRCLPSRQAVSSRSVAGAKIRRPSAKAPSPAFCGGRYSSFTPQRRASSTMGSTPFTPRMPPSRESSPMNSLPSTLSWGRYPEAARIPTAMGKSRAEPSLRRFAGARLTVMRFRGNRYPELRRAVRTRSRASLTAVSASPTISKPGSPRARSTSTVIQTPLRPLQAAPVAFAYMGCPPFSMIAWPDRLRRRPSEKTVLQPPQAGPAVQNAHFDDVEAQVPEHRVFLLLEPF